jgi:cystathionine beta-lyase/cystathionine gamma-synthase
MNPTIRSLETKHATLENAETAPAFCSGMATEANTAIRHVLYPGLQSFPGHHLASLQLLPTLPPPVVLHCFL